MQAWIMLGLKAIKLGFDANEQVDPNKSTKEIESAKQYFYKCLENNPTEAWPYIKLADLIEDPKEKIKLYTQAFRVEPNVYSVQYLFDKILIDHPDILDNYIL